METKNTITSETKKIAEAVANKREDLFSNFAYDQITNQIWWAWENWDKQIIKSYYEGDIKPEEPTYDFRYNHVFTELEQVPENYEDLIESFKG
jgi:hypothetical protein